MTTTIADRIINFLGNLQGMDHFKPLVEEPRTAVIDLGSGAIIEADPDYPDGDILVYENANGKKSHVHTYKLIEQLFLRHAYELHITDGGTVKKQYDHIAEHFPIKTGYGQ
jgi:hypothetical protein